MIELKKLNKYRAVNLEQIVFLGQTGHPNFGIFLLKSKIDNKVLKCIVSTDAFDWDHVSVSRKDRCPNWEEMCQVKDTFFDVEESVMQYHAAKSEWVNNHEYCLHLWKPNKMEIPKPPKQLV